MTRVEPIDPDAHAPTDASDPGPAPTDASDPAPAPPPARAADASGLGAVIGEGGSAYDDLFGRTLHRSIEAAAVRAAAEDAPSNEGADEQASEATLDVEALDLESSEPLEPAESPESEDDRTPPAGVTAATVGPGPAAASGGDTPPESSGDFIDWVPGMRRTTPEAARTARASDPSGAGRARTGVVADGPGGSLPSGGTTVLPPRAESPSAPSRDSGQTHAAASPAPSTGQAPTAPAQAVSLPGAVCENRHANPPEATSCRWCGARIRGGVRAVTRPPLGMIEISTGGRFLLDRSAIVGRRPRASRVSGDHVPQLITVPSPQQDISRSHVALRLEGWHVVAEDLRTTNGTTLLRSGEVPQRLRTGQSPVLTDGDRLDLGDGVVLTLLGRPS